MSAPNWQSECTERKGADGEQTLHGAVIRSQFGAGSGSLLRTQPRQERAHTFEGYGPEEAE